MDGLSNLISSYALCAALSGCSDDTRHMTFAATVMLPVPPVAAEVSTVESGEAQIVTLGELTIEFEHEYPSYRILSSSDDTFAITIELMDGRTVHGQTEPGVCAEACVYDHCPSPDTIDNEHLKYTVSGDFLPIDYACFYCSGGGKSAPVCQ